MAMQGYTTIASRNLIRAAQGMLEHAQPIIVLGDFGEQRQMPKNNTDTIVFRRTLPFGAAQAGSGINGSQYVGTPQIVANSFVLSEGTTPNSNTISFQDVSVTLQNYGVLFKLTSKTAITLGFPLRYRQPSTRSRRPVASAKDSRDDLP